MSLEKISSKIEPENELIGKGYNPDSSMGFLSWTTVMNNISEIFSNSEFIKSIESGKYNLLIADDSSGRIPALIFRKIISQIYHEKNIPNPKLFFIPGQRLSEDKNIYEKISSHINKYLEQVNLPRTETHSLIVTNTITSGKTLEILSEALLKSDIDCDIVATSLEISPQNSKEKKEGLESTIGRKIFTAVNDETSRWAGLNHRPYSHGVTKNPGDMVSTKITGVQDHINAARKMVDKISEEIIRQIHSTEPLLTDEERYHKNLEYIHNHWSLSEE